MNRAAAERAADAAALEFVANLFQRPDQLEKLDSLKKRAERKKAAVEAMLRTGVQSQLEGIRTGMNHLQTASVDISLIQKDLHEVLTSLQTIPKLKNRLSKLSEANVIHSQYAAAMDNLNHIFNINETIDQTSHYINEEDLLRSHKNIMDLENARDDLMNEVHKLQADRKEYDINLLNNYFLEVGNLVKELEKKLWYICKRALDSVRSEHVGPQQLVSALRIIEREQRIDDYYKKQRQASEQAFLPPGRPRNWRKKLFEVLSDVVEQRIVGNQLEDRWSNKQWLVRYLEVCRRTVLEDLKVIKSALVPCFPPHYSIYDRYIKYYHDSLSKRIREIAEEKLEKNEVVQLLSWIKEYSSESMLGNPRLGIQIGPFLQDHPLLTRTAHDLIYERFIDLAESDMTGWLDTALQQERDEWTQEKPPEENNDQTYYTHLPTILFGMVEEQVTVAKAVSSDIVPRIIGVSCDCFIKAAIRYQSLLGDFKQEHYEDGRKNVLFTATIIAAANNMDICTNFTDTWEVHVRLNLETASNSLSPRLISSACNVNREELMEKINQLKNKWQNALQFAISVLLDQLKNDMGKHIEVLFTKTWLRGSFDLKSIIMTVEDYYSEYLHLRPHIRLALIKEIVYKLIGEYLVAIDSRRLTFSTYQDRQMAAARMREDSESLEMFFKQLGGLDFDYPALFSVLPAMADILDLTDKSLLSLETSGFVRKFPDIGEDLLTSLIALREDCTRQEAKSLADMALANIKHIPKGTDQVMVKLFQTGKANGKRTLPALEETMHNMFATLVMTANKVN